MLFLTLLSLLVQRIFPFHWLSRLPQGGTIEWQQFNSAHTHIRPTVAWIEPSHFFLLLTTADCKKTTQKVWFYGEALPNSDGDMCVDCLCCNLFMLFKLLQHPRIYFHSCPTCSYWCILANSFKSLWRLNVPSPSYDGLLLLLFDIMT